MCNNCDNIGNNVVLLGALISITLAKNLSVAEQDFLGNLLQVIAQNLLSMAATVNDCQIICEKKDSSKNTNDTSNNTNKNTDINNNNINSNTKSYF